MKPGPLGWEDAVHFVLAATHGDPVRPSDAELRAAIRAVGKGGHVAPGDAAGWIARQRRAEAGKRGREQGSLF